MAEKTRRTPAERAQDNLDRAEETLRTKANVVHRLEEELDQARKRLATALAERDYAFAHPALKSQSVGEFVSADPYGKEPDSEPVDPEQ